MDGKKNLNRVDVGRAAQAACLLEAASPKPGNVNRYFDFADTNLSDFLISAVMIGRSMERAHRNPVGKTVLSAFKATRRMVARNTNLGMILLFTPLARAYGDKDLRRAVCRVLESLTVADARLVYRAIRLAAPGGLGRVSAHDVANDADIALLAAMKAAGERDAVAREYATGFEITFTLGYPLLDNFLNQGRAWPEAVIQTYLAILAEVPDTLIARKKGMQTALDVSRRAAGIMRAGGNSSLDGREQIRKLDVYLRSEENSLNPGTTADLTAVAIFTLFLQKGLGVWSGQDHPGEELVRPGSIA